MEIEAESLAIKIEKLKVSEPVISTGLEYEKQINEYDSFRYYVAGLRIEDTDYTVKLVVGVKNGLTYYDHAITPIEKKKLLKSIDEIKRPFASKESSDDGEQVSDVLSHFKDKRLISILQGNS